MLRRVRRRPAHVDEISVILAIKLAFDDCLARITPMSSYQALYQDPGRCPLRLWPYLQIDGRWRLGRVRQYCTQFIHGNDTAAGTESSWDRNLGPARSI